MRKNIVSAILLIVSISAILGTAVSTAKADTMRHEFRDGSSKTRHSMYLNSGLDCQSPMQVFSAQSVIVTREADIKLSAKQISALRQGIIINGSALVCVDNGATLIF